MSEKMKQLENSFNCEVIEPRTRKQDYSQDAGNGERPNGSKFTWTMKHDTYWDAWKHERIEVTYHECDFGTFTASIHNRKCAIQMLEAVINRSSA